jgi:hypothetical protein
MSGGGGGGGGGGGYRPPAAAAAANDPYAAGPGGSGGGNYTDPGVPQAQKPNVQLGETHNFSKNWRDPKTLHEAFYHFDREAQGAISVDEWRGIMSSNGKKMRPGEVDDFIAEADPQGSGWIQYQWFIDNVLGPGLAK